MTCMCGDNECPSCGLAQGTLAPSYDHGARVVIGKSPDGHEVILDFVVKTYGESGDVRTQEDGKVYVGPYVRFCVTGSTPDPGVVGGAGQLQDWIRANVDRYQELYVSRKWLDRILDFWDQYHMNDMRPSADPKHEGQECICVIPEKDLDEILDLVEEGSVASNLCRDAFLTKSKVLEISPDKIVAFRKAWDDMVKANETSAHKLLVPPTYCFSDARRNFSRIFVEGCNSMTIKLLGAGKATVVYEDGTETGEMALDLPRIVTRLLQQVGIDPLGPACFKLTRRGEGIHRYYLVQPLWTKSGRW